MKFATVLLLISNTVLAAETPKLATIEFQTRGVDRRLGSTLSDRFAVFLRKRGATVFSQKDIAAVLSLERQRQLLGCVDASSSCAAELAGALGAAILVSGQVVKIGNTIEVSVKAVDTSSTQTRFSGSRTANSEDDIFDALEALAADVMSSLNAGAVTGPSAARSRTPGWILIGTGAGVLGAGAALFIESSILTGNASAQANASLTPSAVDALVAEGQRLRIPSIVTLGVGVVAIAAGIVWAVLSGPDSPVASLFPHETAKLFALW